MVGTAGTAVAPSQTLVGVVDPEGGWAESVVRVAGQKGAGTDRGTVAEVFGVVRPDSAFGFDRQGRGHGGNGAGESVSVEEVGRAGAFAEALRDPMNVLVVLLGRFGRGCVGDSTSRVQLHSFIHGLGAWWVVQLHSFMDLQ